MNPRNATSQHRKKVESGCRTCKLRKVKCDETWPICRRCQSTGRTCDGYGIWGGGTSHQQNDQEYARRDQSCRTASTITRQSIPPFAQDLSVDEHYFLDWFSHRTALKLPGVFGITRGIALLFQAANEDPAILHAIIALSSVHQMEMGNGISLTTRNGGCDDRFVLSQYNKAIGSLQRNTSKVDTKSTRLALVACLQFTTLEFLRGHYQSGRKHLHFGLRLLIERLQLSRTPPSSIDVWVAGSLIRTYVQAKILGQATIYIDPTILTAPRDAQITNFDSTYQARRLLEHILLQIFDLQEMTKTYNSESETLFSYLQSYQAHILKGLKAWRAAHKATSVGPDAYSPQEDFGYRLLRLYYTMTRIMAMTATSQTQTCFDLHTDDFVSILSQCIQVYRMLFLDQFVANLHSDPGLRGARTTSDVGWIPPLYYTALKCRVHRIRLQAIRLIELSMHKEGIWDAHLAAVIGRKVMEIEESGVTGVVDDCDTFDTLSEPTKEELSGPLPSNDARIHEIEVILPEDKVGRLVLRCWRRNELGAFDAIKGVYDLPCQHWSKDLS